MTYTIKDILTAQAGSPVFEPENYPAVFDVLVSLRDELFAARDRALSGASTPAESPSELWSPSATADGLYDTSDGLARAIPLMIAEKSRQEGTP